MQSIPTHTSLNREQPVTLNDDDWDRFVASQQNGWLTMTSVWGQVLQESFPNIIEKTVVVTENGQILGGLPLYECKSLWHTKKLVSTPVAAVMGLTYNNRFSAEALGWDHEKQKLEPVIALFWRTIQWAHAHDFSVFDFGKTAADNQPLLHFKYHWGSRRRNLELYSNSCAHEKRFDSTVQLKVQTILKKLPEPLYGLISMMFYL